MTERQTQQSTGCLAASRSNLLMATDCNDCWVVGIVRIFRHKQAIVDMDVAVSV